MNDQQQLRYLELENAKLRAEAALLRKKLGENARHTKRINQAYEDALLLAMWKVSGFHPSREYAAQHDITQNRWENAVALLKLARIIVRHRHWAIKNLTVIEQRLATARQKAIETPELFFMRLNAHAAS